MYSDHSNLDIANSTLDAKEQAATIALLAKAPYKYTRFYLLAYLLTKDKISSQKCVLANGSYESDRASKINSNFSTVNAKKIIL